MLEAPFVGFFGFFGLAGEAGCMLSAIKTARKDEDQYHSPPEQASSKEHPWFDRNRGIENGAWRGDSPPPLPPYPLPHTPHTE
jgi:hypothetical protein